MGKERKNMVVGEGQWENSRVNKLKVSRGSWEIGGSEPERQE